MVVLVLCVIVTIKVKASYLKAEVCLLAVLTKLIWFCTFSVPYFIQDSFGGFCSGVREGIGCKF